IVFVGHPQRGTLYAVYSFLEDAVGVRWWTSTESFIPKKPTLEIPVQNVEYAPKLIYRWAYYKDANSNGVFASRMKCNGQTISAEYGGNHTFQYFVHSFFPLIPPAKYFEKHPEWYSEINGQRKHEHTQLCLTNDEMRAELTKNALESLRKNPKAGFISISQNDWAGYCTCAKCKAIDDEEGSHAGTLIRFVNKVAEDIEKEFPNVWVETLAYQYTRKPPKLVKPRKNVVIRLCTIECSFVQPLGTGDQNKTMREDMEGWSKIADNLFVWDYTVNFSAYMLPHPNHRVLAPNVRFFVDNNTIGLFEQGDSYCSAGDFVRLKNWVLSKLMWNPSLDENKLFDEFLMGYYGPVFGPAIKKYLNVLHDRAEESGVFLRCFMNSTNDWLDFDTWYRAANVVDDEGTWAKTSALMDDTDMFSEEFKTIAAYVSRVSRDVLPLNLVFLKEYNTFQRKADLSKMDVEEGLFDNPLTALDYFFDLCKDANVQAYREYDKPEHFAAFEKDMYARFGPPAAPPEFCKDLPKSSWYEVQNLEFNLGKLGEWTFSIEDEKASNKRAVKMPGTHYEWATSYTFDGSLLDLTPREPPTASAEAPEYRLKAAVRCDAKEGVEGKAMTLGVYDPENKKGVVSKTLTVAEIAGSEYRWIDLGVLPLKPKQYVWFAPPRRTGEIDAVYIDRIVIVRER
ncbi:MAG: DUF4838 domain-containing protein, partial [Planctomycetaceae bacterium]|nr:DUF4838 domain-containing protein [Planctomycetaceae bacterium]